MQRQACEAVGQMLRPGPKPQPATLQAGITHHTAASLYMMVLALRQQALCSHVMEGLGMTSRS